MRPPPRAGFTRALRLFVDRHRHPLRHGDMAASGLAGYSGWVV
jgi:hypothetical protein